MDPALLGHMLADPYFSRPPPKSTGREHFNLSWLERALCQDIIPPQNVQATICELTAASISRAVVSITPRPQRVLICGGGVLIGR